MKKLKIILITMLLILLVGVVKINAAESKLTITGDNKVTVGETKKVTVKVETTGNAIAGIEGRIKSEGNIEIKSVSGTNNWSLMYNSGTGKFNIYKVENLTKSEQIMEIEYTAGSTEGTGKIILEGLEAATIEDDSETLGNISKEITIESKQDDPAGDEDKDKDPAGDTDTDKDPAGDTDTDKDPAGDTDTDKDPAGDTDTDKDPAGNENKNPTENTGNKDNTTAKENYPDTGVEKLIIPAIIITVLGFVAYIGNKKYKNI